MLFSLHSLDFSFISSSVSCLSDSTNFSFVYPCYMFHFCWPIYSYTHSHGSDICFSFNLFIHFTLGFCWKLSLVDIGAMMGLPYKNLVWYNRVNFRTYNLPFLPICAQNNLFYKAVYFFLYPVCLGAVCFTVLFLPSNFNSRFHLALFPLLAIKTKLSL